MLQTVNVLSRVIFTESTQIWENEIIKFELEAGS